MIDQPHPSQISYKWLIALVFLVFASGTQATAINAVTLDAPTRSSNADLAEKLLLTFKHRQARQTHPQVFRTGAEPREVVIRD